MPVKSVQTSSQVLTEPMPDKHQHQVHNQHQHHSAQHISHEEEIHNENHNHNHHHSPRDLFTADSQLSEQLTPAYPQPRFYDPVSSRTLNSKRTRENSKRFSFDQNQHSDHSHQGCIEFKPTKAIYFKVPTKGKGCGCSFMSPVHLIHSSKNMGLLIL